MRLRSKLGKLGSQNSLQGSVRDKDRVTEEPCAVKVASTVLEPSGEGDPVA